MESADADRGNRPGAPAQGMMGTRALRAGATRLVMAKRQIKLEVRLTPRAGRDEIGGVRDGVLQVRVKAPPVDGKANESLRRLIAKRAGVPNSRVTIVRGARSRRKLVAIEGTDLADARELAS
jgi:uncharacterized protein